MAKDLIACINSKFGFQRSPNQVLAEGLSDEMGKTLAVKAHTKADPSTLRLCKKMQYHAGFKLTVVFVDGKIS